VDKKAKGGAWLHNRKISFCSLAVAAFLDLALFYVTGKSDHLVVTPLAYLVIVAVYSVRLLTKYLNQQMLLKDRENQLLQSRTTVALGQIRSHFIFNLLNAISGMCKSNPAKADETIVCFSRYLRANIDILQSDKLMPFYQILETLEDYIVLEQVRFGDRIAFEADIEEDDFLMPPLVLQPIVENAIKHGLTAKVEGGTIWLSTRSDSNWVYITVTDDGVGFQQHELHKKGSVGLQNVRFRLKHMVDGNITIESTPGLGTSVQIMIPRKEG
jgi:sensor histidine kinase YesM